MNNFKQTALAAALALSATPLFAADFKQLDSNNDQQLSRSELQSHADQRKLSIDQLLQSFDRDGNQQLSQQEFTDSTSAPMEVAEADGTGSSQAQAVMQQPGGAQPATAYSAQASAEPQSLAAQDANPEAAASGPERTTITVNQKPAKVTVSNTAPKVTVHQPKPQVSIQTREPVVNVEQSEPTVSVNQAQPEVAVDLGRPAVDVEQAEPRVAVEQPEPEVSAQLAEPVVSTQAVQPVVNQPVVGQPVVNVGSEQQRAAEVNTGLPNDTRTGWAHQSVGDLQGQTLYDQNGQELGEVAEVVLDAQQRPALLIDTQDQSEQSFVRLESVSIEQDQLRVSGAEQARPLSEVQDVDSSQLQPVTDANRSVESLLSGGAVSVR